MHASCMYPRTSCTHAAYMQYACKVHAGCAHYVRSIPVGCTQSARRIFAVRDTEDACRMRMQDTCKMRAAHME
eukprot:6650144-Alexandrium_andersonii.AAC.1